MKNQKTLVGSALYIMLCLSLVNCTPKEEEKECYRCTYTNPLPDACMDSYHIDMCVLRPYEQSLQSVMLIEVYCNGELESSRERISFKEDFFAEQANSGGMCEPR